MSARIPAAQGRDDANHAEIVGAYEELYCKVKDTSAVGGGFPDTVVRIPTRWGHILALVEIKTRDGTYTPAQKRFIAEWGASVRTVRCREDVFAHVEEVRARK